MKMKGKLARGPCLSRSEQRDVFESFLEFAVKWYTKKRADFYPMTPEDMAYDACQHLVQSPNINDNVLRLIRISKADTLATLPDVGPYCRAVIVKYGLSELRRRRRQNHKHAKYETNIAQSVHDMFDRNGRGDPFNTIEWRVKELFEILYREAEADPKAKQDVDILYDRHVEGASLYEIAVSYGVSEAEPSNALKRVIRKLKTLPGFAD